MSKSKVISRWTSEDREYRLIAQGNWSEGFVDRYVVEVLGKDTLGDPRWDSEFSWTGPDSRSVRNVNERQLCALADAVKQGLLKNRDPIVQKIVEYLRSFADAAPMIDGILEGLA